MKAQRTVTKFNKQPIFKRKTKKLNEGSLANASKMQEHLKE